MDSSEDLAEKTAEALKNAGNALFKKKEYAEAVKQYSEAILIEPENEVLYSNRSAAHLGNEAKSKALWDAEKCVELKSNWGKGYSRLGAAQHALGRFVAAQESYLKAIELAEEAGQSTLSFQAGLDAAKDGERRATELKIKEAQEVERAQAEAARMKIAEEAAKREEERDETNVDNFFKALAETEDEREKKKRKMTHPITEKYKAQKLGSGKEHIQRLANKHAEFTNLNPYLVLQLDIDATIDDIKMRYRRLSALCHPDKNLDDTDRARLAFEAIKTAYNILNNPKQRDRTILVIEGARQRAMRDFQALKAKSVYPVQEPDLDKHIMKTFAENEMKRRDVEEHKRAYAARERAQEEEKKKAEEDQHKFEEQWSSDDRRNARIDFWQQFQDDESRAANQKRLRSAKNFKQQQKAEHKPKHGHVELESWRRDWK